MTQVGPHWMSDPHNFADRHLFQNIIFVFLSEKEKILDHFNFPPQITKMIHAHMTASKPGYQISTPLYKSLNQS